MLSGNSSFEFVTSDITGSKDGSEGEYGDWIGVMKGWGGCARVD